ncbi:MAG: hypothetical protein ACKVRN_03230 [Pyrinomonadaceae bacterium]
MLKLLAVAFANNGDNEEDGWKMLMTIMWINDGDLGERHSKKSET